MYSYRHCNTTTLRSVWMVYHQGMRTFFSPSSIKAIVLALLGIAILAACAPPGPMTRGDRQASIGGLVDGDSVMPQRRTAKGSDERADRAIMTLQQSVRSNSASAQETLALLSPYTINELQWQRQTHRNNEVLSAWIELAVVVQTHKLHVASLENELDDWLERFRSRLDDPQAARSQAISWATQWRALEHGPQRIGVILPGDSALERPGEMIKDGLVDAWLALPPSDRPEFFFYYVNDNDLASLYAAVDQANNDQVQWLVGPLSRDQVAHVLANRSARWQLPTLFLNVPTEPLLLRGLNERRLAFALSPEDDARQAGILAQQMGFDRALVLAQDSPWGERMALAFGNSFQSQGQLVVESARYDPSRVDHSTLLESVLELDQSKARIASLERIVGESISAQPQRRGDIDVIFLASREADARQIRPQLQFFRAEDLPVVTTSLAVNGALDARRDVDLEGVYLPIAPWFMNDTPQEKMRLAAQVRHPGLAESSWSHLYAMGHDIAELMRWLEPMTKDPELELEGMTGQLRIGQDWKVQRQLSHIQVVNGRSKTLPYAR